jgi:broad specificity phosphatase PhoE
MLLALFDAKHLHHHKARQWWRENRAGGWATCPLTENGFLRIAAQPGYSNPVPLADALALVRGWARPPDHAFWPDDVSLLDAAIVDHSRVLGPRLLVWDVAGMQEGKPWEAWRAHHDQCQDLGLSHHPDSEDHEAALQQLLSTSTRPPQPSRRPPWLQPLRGQPLKPALSQSKRLPAERLCAAH